MGRDLVSALLIGLGSLIVGPSLSPILAQAHHVAVVNIDRTIDPVSAGYLIRAIDNATADGAQLLVVKLNTPGGLLSSTREMVGAIVGARIPVAVYVSPSGARAASAGTFITAAANFAVMSPGTNIGAASPVAAGGQDLPKTLAKKIHEDTAAFIRSIAETRGRDAGALEETVTKARSYTASEAVERNIVDFIARDQADLLAQLDGRTAKTTAGTVVLETRNAPVREIRLTLLESFLGVLANPNLAFVLLTLGGLAVLVEVLLPGFVGPGVVGGISLLLAFVGMGHLSVNWVGVALILFSMLLMYLELQQPGLGIFGVGALISFVLGGLLLFGSFFSTPQMPEPGIGVSSWILGSFAVLLATFLLFFLYIARSTGSPTGFTSDSEAALSGQPGVALTDLTPSGKIGIGNEEWTATTDLGDLIQQGEHVRVIGVYGGVLKVTKQRKNQGRK